MKNTFIKINHHVVKLDTIIGIASPYWSKVDVEEKKSTLVKKRTLGIPRKKTRRAYGFSVILTECTLTVYPSDAPFHSSSNTKEKCLREYRRITELLLDLKDEDKE